nr:uncharacterized protein LOC129041563 [Pongo pygmaeus]
MRLSRSLPSTTRVATSTATRGHTGDRDSRVCAHADAPICTRTGALRGPVLLTAGRVFNSNILNYKTHPPERTAPHLRGPVASGLPRGLRVSVGSPHVSAASRSSPPLAGFCFHLLISQSLILTQSKILNINNTTEAYFVLLSLLLLPPKCWRRGLVEGD